MIELSPEVEVLCDECGKRAATFELLPPGVARRRKPEHPLRDIGKRWFYFESFMRSGDSEESPGDYQRLRDILVARDFDALYGVAWQLAVFWCCECRRSYCIDDWSTEFDDHPMCSAFGTCPRGHGKILDDQSSP